MSLILDGTTGVPVTTVTGTLPVANGGTGGSTGATMMTAFTTGGTSTVYTLTPSPAITVYTSGQSFSATFSI